MKALSIFRAEQIAQLAEKVYSKVMFDANLLSFKPRENYPVIVYRDRFEYQRMSGFPDWSAGGTQTEILGQVLPSERNVRALTSIQTFEEVLTPPALAHEVAHLVFNEYMGFFTEEDADRVRWLNEGFAMFQEVEARDSPLMDEHARFTLSLVRSNPMPLSKLAAFNPFREPQTSIGSYSWGGRSILYGNVEIWYWQTRDLVRFLIKTQSPYNFYRLLEALKQRKPLEQAISEAYSGKWRSLAELEESWKQSLK